MQSTHDHNGGINLYFIFCTENMAIRQSNQCRPRSGLRKLVWFYAAGVFLSLIIHSHIFCMENMAIRQIKQSRHRSDLDTEANKFYDRSNQLYDAALLTRGYTQHALRPYIDSEINHNHHYIKVSFINRGMDFIDLPSIFRFGDLIHSYLFSKF